MIINGRSQREGDPNNVPSGTACPFCGEPVQPNIDRPAVFWGFVDSTRLYLHARCASNLVCGLARDLDEIASRSLVAELDAERRRRDGARWLRAAGVTGPVAAIGRDEFGPHAAASFRKDTRAA